MRVLVACEESQEVCKAFRALGHEAYSCDIEPCSGGHPEWHIQVDALELLKMRWDMILAFPPCTYVCSHCFDYHAFREDFGEYTHNGNHPFCRKCGKAMTDEAVEMVMERLETLNDAGNQ